MTWPGLSLALLTLLLSCRPHHRLAGLADLLESSGPVYLFTDPDRSTPDPFAVRNMIIGELDGAEESIDFWFYGFDDPTLAAALLRARNRGVKLNLTGSPDQDYTELTGLGLDPKIRRKEGIQHAKLLLIDQRVLISGTGNFTRSCMFYNDNVFFRMLIDRETAGRILRTMTEEDTYHAPVSWSDGAAHLRLMASPAAGSVIQSAITQAVLEAHSSIRFLIFSFTDPALAGALLEKARSGVQVEGVFESSGAVQPDRKEVLYAMNIAAGGAPLILYADGNDHIYYDRNDVIHGGKMHHKTMIIDDRRVLTGSFNWTTSARDSNLEAFFEIDDPAAPRAFTFAFERIRANGRAVPRPPFEPASLPPIEERASPCPPPPDADFDRLILHAGHGAFFRGLVFSRGDCTAADRTSAGFEQSSQFALGLPASSLLVDFRPGSFLPTGSPESPPPFNCNADGCDPCARGACFAVRLRRISFEGGWVLLDPAGRRPTGSEVWIWHRGGLERRPAHMLDEEMLVFTPPSSAPSGALLLFPGEGGDLGIGCAFAALPRAPSVFLDGLVWFYPHSFADRMPCTAPD